MRGERGEESEDAQRKGGGGRKEGRGGAYVAEGLNLVHERMQASGDPAEVVPLPWVPVELLDAIDGPAVLLEAKGVLVARPATRVGVKQEPLLVLLGDVVVEVLSERELPVELRE